MALIAAGVNLAGSAIGSHSSAKSQERANEMSIEQAREDRAWQEGMSSSAHQREVADLRAAGLNPILSANKGASTPTGAMPTIHSVAPSRGELAVSTAKAASEIALAGQLAKTEQTKQVLNLASSARQAEQTKLLDFGNVIRKGISDVFAWGGKSASHAVDFISRNNPVALGGRVGLRIAEAERKG